MLKKLIAIITTIISIAVIFVLIQPTEYEIRMKETLIIKKQSSVTTFDGIEEPSMPDEDENNETLLGVDKNKNQLRDDLEIWVNRFAKNYNERMALRQASINLEYMLVAAGESKKEIMIHAASVSYTDFECTRFVFGNKKALEIDSVIRAMVINNKMRKDILGRFNQFTYGYESIVENPNLAEPFRACFFKIENEEISKKLFKESLSSK